MPACVAILYNPEDKRYLHLKNKKIKLPIFDIIVPLIADEEVDKDKGTGLVMCCTFGDFFRCNMAKKNITCLTCVRTYLPAIYGNFDRGNDDHKSHFETHPIFRQTRPCGFHGYVPLSFLVSNCFFFGDYYKSSLFLSCFHPQRHSRSSSSPGTVVLSCRDGQSFHQSRGF